MKLVWVKQAFELSEVELTEFYCMWLGRDSQQLVEWYNSHTLPRGLKELIGHLDALYNRPPKPKVCWS